MSETDEPIFKDVPLSEWFNPSRMTKPKTNLVLSSFFTEKGTKRWWQTPSPELDGQTPEQMWKDDKPRVYELALTYLTKRFS